MGMEGQGMHPAPPCHVHGIAKEKQMGIQSGMQADIEENMIAMLECLASRLEAGKTSDEAYSKTLKYLRFRIGESLFDHYATPFAKEIAERMRIGPDRDFAPVSPPRHLPMDLDHPGACPGQEEPLI
jgi:hypothetical protein